MVGKGLAIYPDVNIEDGERNLSDFISIYSHDLPQWEIFI